MDYMSDRHFRIRSLIVSIFLLFYVFNCLYEWIEIENSGSWNVGNPCSKGLIVESDAEQDRPFHCQQFHVICI